ncbi:MAG: Coenzyme F420 hydrogenase/dehydrogenase, beta subunit C-terminal domain [Defluviitaleaceae bacterium]|nr:Coenzyme F420 hydrogenase/dehydrogenase, beta subunit C-terminal domain [Defluviitaleaceae bacterium]
MIEITDKKLCSGCSACQAACKIGCISMLPDLEGFFYPTVDMKNCTHCKKCLKSCPVLNPKPESSCPQKGYVVNHKETSIRAESTSGGAFTPIAQYILEKGGVVFGAAFDDNFQVIHRYVDKAEDLGLFRGSKYVQSDMNDCYSVAKAFLEDDRWVCFSGTPCQIEGLHQFLGRNYDHLITVDFVCHAIPSPLVWKKYLIYMKERLKSSTIIDISFRDKSKFGYQYPHLSLTTPNKTYYAGIESDPFTRSFFEHLSIRPICCSCPFKKRYRVNDFTIWDCFYPENFDSALDDNKGSTCVLIHTQKGVTLFTEILEVFKFREIKADTLVNGVKEMFSGTLPNPRRMEFFIDINRMDERSFFNKYFSYTPKVVLTRCAKVILAKTNLYKVVKRYAKKV